MNGKRMALGAATVALAVWAQGGVQGSSPASPPASAPASAAAGAAPAGAGPAAAGSMSVLWGASRNTPGVLYTIDPASGQATAVVTIDAVAGPRGLSLLGEVLYGSDVFGIPGRGAEFDTGSIDRMSGATGFLSDQGGSTAWDALASNDSAGVLYSVDGNGVLQVLAPDGTLEAVGEGGPLDVAGLAYDDGNGILYAAVADRDAALYTIDTASGAATLVGALKVDVNDGAGLAFDEETGTLFLNARTALYTVDVTTGGAQLIGLNGVEGIGGLAWQPGEVEMDPCLGCPCLADVSRDGVVDTTDLLAVLVGWGACPMGAGGPQGGLLMGLASGEPGVLYTLDPATGVGTEVARLNGTASFAGLSFLDRTLFGSDLFGYPGGSGNIDTGSIDTGEGLITFLSDQDGSFDWHALAANETDGVLYAVDLDAGGRPLRVLHPDGTVETIGQGTGLSARGLAYDDRNGILYAVAPDEMLWTIDTTDGTAAPIGGLGVATGGTAGLAYDESAGALFLNVADGPDSALYTVDVATGEATLVGLNEVPGIDGLAWLASNPCDSCPCPADVTRDGRVDTADLLQLLIGWGTCE